MIRFYANVFDLSVLDHLVHADGVRSATLKFPDTQYGASTVLLQLCERPSKAEKKLSEDAAVRHKAVHSAYMDSSQMGRLHHGLAMRCGLPHGFLYPKISEKEARVNVFVTVKKRPSASVRASCLHYCWCRSEHRSAWRRAPGMPLCNLNSGCNFNACCFREHRRCTICVLHVVLLSISSKETNRIYVSSHLDKSAQLSKTTPAG